MESTAEPPQLLTAARVITPDIIVRVRNKYWTHRRLRYGRSTPRWKLLALGLPHSVAIVCIEGEQEGITLSIALQDDEIVPDDRRAGGSPFVCRNVVCAQVEPPKVNLPKQTPAEIVSIDTLRSEPRDDYPSVGCGSRIGIGRFDVTLIDWHTLVSYTFPQDLAGSFVERIKHPSLLRSICRCIAITVQ